MNIFKKILSKLSPPSNRKRVLVYPRFQLSIIGINIGLALFMVLIFYIENVYLYSRFRESDLKNAQAFSQLYYTLASEKALVNLIFTLTAVSIVVLMVIFGLILSHRVSGPLVKLKNHMDSIANGQQPTPVRFRKNDYFRDISESFNQMLERLKN